MKSRVIAILTKFILFGAILVLFLMIMEKAFAPSYWFPRNRLQDRTARLGAFTLEEPDTIDILAIGDSEALQGFVPMDLWKEYGFTSYTLGSDGLRTGEALYYLKVALKTQHPKVIFLETDLLFRYKTLDELETEVAQRIYYHFEGLRYHNLWKQPFELEGVRRYYKGYLINETVAPYEKEPDYMSKKLHWTMLTRIPRLNNENFEEILKLCKRNNIHLVLYSLPSTVNYNYERVEALAKYAEQKGVPYFDLNTNEEIGIDWSADTPDGGDHLNLFGARKVTSFLGKYAADNGLAQDHRNDEAYADWHEQAAAFDQLVIEMEGKYFGDIEEERNEMLEEERERERERR